MSDWSEALRQRAKAALPKVEGELRLATLREPVEIVRDRWGVPHIYATNLPDLFFAQGYTIASERLFQMELSIRVGSGRLSEMFGPLLLPMDRFVRTAGWNRAGRRLTEQWDDLSWEMAEAFMDGARTWLATMPLPPLEYEVLQLDPWLPEGREGSELLSAAVVYLAWSLSGNWDAELLRASIAEQLGWEATEVLFPDMASEPAPVRPAKVPVPGARSSAVDLLAQAPILPLAQGSNNWVVAGSRSVTGMPLLANDPHLLVQLPSPWYEIHLSGPETDVLGVSLPFIPGVIIGHNARMAWGLTVLFGDTQDLYLERLNDEGTAALYEGAWEPLAVHREEIRVRGQDDPLVVDVKETRHGPILDSYMIGIANPEVVQGVRETYALRFVAFEEGISLSTTHRLNTASNFEEFRSALSHWGAPGAHFLYADVEGNIGYQCAGWHPVRRNGDGTVPARGWTEEYEWEGYVPFEELPWAYNPSEGYLVTANNKPHDDSYPHLLGKDFLPGFRARRIAQLITDRPKHDLASFSRMQMDTLSLPAMAIVPHLLAAEPGDDRQVKALSMLSSWDLRLSADSPGAALYQAWSRRLGDAILRPLLGEELFRHFYSRRQWTNAFQYQVLPDLLAFPTARWFGEDGRAARDAVLRRALDAALAELTESMGEDMSGWRWGNIHRVRFVGQLAMTPELAEVFTAGEAPIGGDEQTVLQSMYEPGAPYQAVIVPSWRQIIDLEDLDRSVGVNCVGQSGNPGSPHFNDDFQLWSAGEYHEMPFSRAAVEAATTSRLLLLPA